MVDPQLETEPYLEAAAQKSMRITHILWGVLQVATGPLSDRFGRKELIAGGMIVQAAGIWVTVLVPTFSVWVVGAVLQGLGTAMVYPTLLAAITDSAHPSICACSWMRLGCGLVNRSNPCRCAKKARGFMQAGYIDPESLLFARERIKQVHEVARSRAEARTSGG